MDASKILGASDEDFLNMAPPGVISAGEENSQQQEEQEQEQESEETVETESPETNDGQQTEAEKSATEEETDPDQSEEEESSSAEDASKSQQTADDKAALAQKENPAKTVDATENPPSVKGKVTPEKDAKKVDPSGSEGTNENGSTPDYEGFYKKLVGGPIKANGKDIKLQNEEEVLRMIKMGANYTQKMQAMAPHRKILMMLENNGLLNEAQLGFLIDLSKKNPEAIKKLVKDSGIDPLDIDVKGESTYRPGNHSISEDEASFRTTLDDLKSNPQGQETLRVIDTTWDPKSKDVLFSDPSVMELINDHREAGIYQRIAETIEHRRTTGIIGVQVPFLQAYKAVGEELASAGKFSDLMRPQQTAQDSSSSLVPEKNMTAAIVRKGQPKKQVVNTDKVNAAAPTRSSPKKATVVINPLSVSDDDFLKQMSNRV